MHWVAHIEDKCPASIMIIRKEHSASGRHVFRVVDAGGLLVSHDGRHQPSVRWRRRVGIDDSEKVVALERSVTLQANR